MEPQDTITIAPSVLITIVRLAAENEDGVAQMGQIPVDMGRLFRGFTTGSGVVLDINDQTITVDLYIVVDHGVNMAEVSRRVQQAVKRAVKDLVGMEVSVVHVHIEDVEVPGNK
nr:Asp23/Gls24 family envelope stress response protein [Anaerolineae bacterium]